MTLEFICGCKTGDVISRTNVDTMDSVTFDDEGFVICKLHRNRRKGWRSTTAAGRGYSLLAREANLVFGEEWPITVCKVDSSLVEDARDNRDPEDLGKKIISRTDRLKFNFKASEFYDMVV